MLTEILDRWEVLRELQQQQATWQQRWDRAQAAFDESLQAIDARDADRLRQVLAETLTTFGKATTLFTAANSGEHPSATGPLSHSPVALAEPIAAPISPDTSAAPHNAPATINEATVAKSTPEKIEEPAAASTSVQPEPAPSETETSVESEIEYSLDDLLTWATETVGDGMTENALFQELRKSKYSRQARQLFDSLKELDAFHEGNDGVVQVQSLRALGL